MQHGYCVSNGVVEASPHKCLAHLLKSGPPSPGEHAAIAQETDDTKDTT